MKRTLRQKQQELDALCDVIANDTLHFWIDEINKGKLFASVESVVKFAPEFADVARAIVFCDSTFQQIHDWIHNDGITWQLSMEILAELGTTSQGEKAADLLLHAYKHLDLRSCGGYARFFKSYTVSSASSRIVKALLDDCQKESRWSIPSIEVLELFAGSSVEPFLVDRLLAILHSGTNPPIAKVLGTLASSSEHQRIVEALVSTINLAIDSRNLTILLSSTEVLCSFANGSESLRIAHLLIKVGAVIGGAKLNELMESCSNFSDLRVVDFLLTNLTTEDGSPNWGLRLAIIGRLRSFSDSPESHSIVERLLNLLNPSHRVEILGTSQYESRERHHLFLALGAFAHSTESTRILDTLLLLLEHDSSLLRAGTLEALGHFAGTIHEPRVASACTKALFDSSYEVRVRAVEAIATLSDSSKTLVLAQELLENIQPHVDWIIMRETMKALSSFSQASVKTNTINALIDIVTNPAHKGRPLALKILGSFTDSSDSQIIREVLINSLKDHNAYVRRQALVALEKFYPSSKLLEKVCVGLAIDSQDSQEFYTLPLTYSSMRFGIRFFARDEYPLATIDELAEEPESEPASGGETIYYPEILP